MDYYKKTRVPYSKSKTFQKELSRVRNIALFQLHDIGQVYTGNVSSQTTLRNRIKNQAIIIPRPFKKRAHTSESESDEDVPHSLQHQDEEILANEDLLSDDRTNDANIVDTILDNSVSEQWDRHFTYSNDDSATELMNISDSRDKTVSRSEDSDSLLASKWVDKIYTILTFTLF